MHYLEIVETLSYFHPNLQQKFFDEDAMFEPAGELEVDCSSSESEDDVTDNQTTNN